MTIEKISIIDADGQEYTLPITFELRVDPVGRRSSLLSTAFAHGAKDVSDGMFTPREIEVTGKIWADNDAEFNTKWDALAEHLIKDNIKIQNRDRRINILRILSVSHEYPANVDYHYGEISVVFLAVDPFWYSKSAQERETTITSSPKEFQFDIGGKAETHPIITIVNAADNFDFKLENITDDSREFRLQDAGAVNGKTIEIDCQAGTVIRNSTNVIASFSGLFLRLLGGRTNNFKYTGANCTITMQYFSAWI